MRKYFGRGWLRKVYSAVCEYALRWLAVLPAKKNKVVFDNFGGRGFGCDPKYIALELLRSEEALDLVWLARDLTEEFPPGIRPVKYGGARALYELATAGVWVDNFKSAMRVPKKEEQYYIQTWHSSLGLKKNERDAAQLDRSYVKRARKDAAATDLMYSNNGFREEKYRKRFWYNGEVLRCGHPRNAVLMRPPEAVRNMVRGAYGLEADTRILLYAPTFRSRADREVYRFCAGPCLKACEKRFGGKYVCFERLHPNVADLVSEAEEGDRVREVTDYPDMQELMAAADLLVTDYSGSMFEFMLTGKPVFLLAKDLNEYVEEERELYFSFDELPFPAARSEEELACRILSFDAGKYREECRDFMERTDMREDGRGAEVIAHIILEKIK
ncbi:CDP-glycerol glycerophosphotransferase family protein [[Clostridium] hylemonae]|uniref:CDP-glycerol:poly(Glycerophosphate) glycerophosphotransferase n=1 Tax=[Clostridium] hylemonae DSM 15053 TaxID=553973 RepID=C0BWX9_9FIRM|nr:CDP-glycerol glycerophosphotransferase family protein [[Clostridium] hylemonae]EEG75577.1 CDP-glycerol:poly(glycerophosphate) glycerophosphotransferase [[Clostridium] hylemonae DSM 15053]QEK17936.1 Teichoic acid poly(glycerol phosphate) polymerase [[Clostridium] hylemonae DSM 15053]